MDDFPEISTDELVGWLQKKYRRHGEIEDGVAAERLKSLTTEHQVMREALEFISDANQIHLWDAIKRADEALATVLSRTNPDE